MHCVSSISVMFVFLTTSFTSAYHVRTIQTRSKSLNSWNWFWRNEPDLKVEILRLLKDQFSELTTDINEKMAKTNEKLTENNEKLTEINEKLGEYNRILAQTSANQQRMERSLQNLIDYNSNRDGELEEVIENKLYVTSHALHDQHHVDCSRKLVHAKRTRMISSKPRNFTC